MNRRKFFETSLKGTVAGACLGLVGISGCSRLANIPLLTENQYSVKEDQIEVYLDQISDLSIVGKAVKVYPLPFEEKLIIARTDEETYVATSILCTHAGGEVEYHPDIQLFKCTSFSGSSFYTTGQVESGPAEDPLKLFPTVVEDNVLVISMV